ncbi:MAG: hypothetical protein FWG22_05265, partial [Prolixibacteraceae bacterium]|nr:hypothetical protein [Prolixibacteraceae bacterium]
MRKNYKSKENSFFEDKMVFEREKLFDEVIDYFKKAMPVAETELEHKDPFQLIVAVILSAQCTDKRVNMITPALLQQYPDPYKMAQAEPAEVYDYIKSCS